MTTSVVNEIKRLIELNEIDWKHAINNYLATLIGIFIYCVLVFSTLQFYTIHQLELGVLSPVVLIFLIQLWIKMLFFVPRPVTSFIVTDYVEERK